MPVTPFHFGPGFLTKELIPKSFSFRIFLLTQVIIDIEALIFILSNQYPFHRFLHTYFGATFVAMFCIAFGRQICIWLTDAWNNKFANSEWKKITNREISLRAAIVSAFFGSYSQVLLDSVMHQDVKPFSPFHDYNNFLHLFTYQELHWLCLIAGALGLIIFLIRKNGFQTVSRIIRGIIISLIVGVILLMIVASYYFSRYHPFDDGPFTGAVYSGEIIDKVDSAIQLNENLKLEVYNRGENETPIMLLKDQNNSIKWTKLLTVSNLENFKHAKVNKVELNSVNKLLNGYRVRGAALWTYGWEAANFYFDKQGNLKEFYLSW